MMAERVIDVTDQHADIPANLEDVQHTLDTSPQPDIQALPAAIVQAHRRIRRYILRTPLLYSPFMSTSAEVYIKLESEQITGSFKARGAYNKLNVLHERGQEVLSQGIITASTGNHGLACLFAVKACDCTAEIFCHENVTKSKLETLKAYGGNITQFGQDCVDAEVKARHTAKERNVPYVSPYNDLDVIAGQGTIGLEIYEDLPDVDYVLASVGGGGMICGIAAYLKHVNNSIQIIGCQPRNSKVMYESVKAGKIVFEESLPTLSDGTSGAVEDNAVTFALCRDLVDDWLIVEEEDIAKAVCFMVDKHHKLVEGAAGVAIGAFLTNQERFAGKKVVIVACGSNISSQMLRSLLNNNGNSADLGLQTQPPE